MPSAKELTEPKYAICLIGPEGTGKTRAALSFPKVFAITFDPVGLDIIWDPANAQLRANLVHTAPLNGIELDAVFAHTEKPSEKSLDGALALAVQMAKKGLVETILLDGASYLATLKQEHVADDKDTRAMFRQLGGYLNQFFLQRLIPLAIPRPADGWPGVCIISTIHAQRESHDAIEGIQDERNKLYGSSKPLMNPKSNISPQMVGGFRQQVGGMPSAMIYFSNRLEADKEGKEVLNYYAYCLKTFVQEWETEVNAKNRYGLPARLKMTGGNFYKTLLSKMPQKAEAEGATTTGLKSNN